MDFISGTISQPVGTVECRKDDELPTVRIGNLDDIANCIIKASTIKLNGIIIEEDFKEQVRQIVEEVLDERLTIVLPSILLNGNQFAEKVREGLCQAIAKQLATK